MERPPRRGVYPDGRSDATEGGAPEESDTAKMIEQIPPRRRGDSAVDEARLRQQAIGVKLRQMFDDVVSEPVPNEFLDILRRADDKSSSDDV